MKRITLQRPKSIPDEPLYLDTLSNNRRIFAKSRWGDHIKGMVIQEKEGWVLHIGGQRRLCEPYLSRAKLLHDLEVQYGLTLHVEEE